MTADCIECAHAYSNIGTYVLVSGDSDFIHVINTLRTMGKRVVIIGVSWSTSRRLADQVDGLILYDADVDPDTANEPAPVEPVRTPSRVNSSPRQQLPEVIRTIEDIVRTERQVGRTPLLTSLKQRLMRRMPGFDEKTLGFSGFKKLMLRVTQEGNVKLVTVGLVDWVMLSEEPDPPEALTEAASAPQEVPAPEDIFPVEEEFSDQEIIESAPPAIAAEPSGASQPEASSPVAEPVPALQEEELFQLAAASLSDIELPDGPGDDLDHQRVRDLIIMADTLEHREGISHVAFNFLRR